MAHILFMNVAAGEAAARELAARGHLVRCSHAAPQGWRWSRLWEFDLIWIRVDSADSATLAHLPGRVRSGSRLALLTSSPLEARLRQRLRAQGVSLVLPDDTRAALLVEVSEILVRNADATRGRLEGARPA